VAVQADWLEKDLYAVLGVAENAESKTITRAYRKLARELHPDTHPDDAEAAERFKEVTAAYDVIGDAGKRAEYDEFRRAMAGARSWEDDRVRRGGPRSYGAGDAGGVRWGSRSYDAEDDQSWTWFQTGDGGGVGQPWTTSDRSGWTTLGPEDLDDLLGGVMGRAQRRADVPRRGSDLEAVLDLGFEDAVRGLTTDVTVNGPGGTRSFKVRVPAGVDDGQRIRLAGKGGPGVNGGPDGDLYAVVRVARHPTFGRNGLDLTVDVPITWPEAVLGTEVSVPTLEGSSVRVRVPAGTPHGRTLRVRGKGVTTAKGGGDLLVGIRVTVPDQLTDEQRQAVEAVADAFRAA
jgi:molecular chaperone DnaJ